MLLTYFLLGFYILLNVYYYVLLAGIIMSWIPGAQNNKFCRVVRAIGDAYLGPFHGLLVVGFLDFTPIIGFAIYHFIVYVVRSFLI